MWTRHDQGSEVGGESWGNYQGKEWKKVMFERIMFEVKLWIGERHEKAVMWVAWVLPRRVALWAYIRVMAHATQGPYGGDHVEDITYRKAYDRWNRLIDEK